VRNEKHGGAGAGAGGAGAGAISFIKE